MNKFIKILLATITSSFLSFSALAGGHYTGPDLSGQKVVHNITRKNFFAKFFYLKNICKRESETRCGRVGPARRVKGGVTPLLIGVYIIV